MLALLKRIFVGAEGARLRSGWRLAGQMGFWFALTMVLGLPALILMSKFPGSFEEINVGVTGLTIIPSVWLARRFLDRKTMRSLGLAFNRQALRDLLVGIGIAGVQILAIFTIEMQAGWLAYGGTAVGAIRWQSLLGRLLWWGLLFAAVGFYEELLSRGYHLQNLEEGTNLFWAVLLSSGFFGAMHLFNPGATWISSLLVGAAGVFFAFAYLRTRQLWLPIGMHIGWNFFEGPVFGYPVSGMQLPGLLVHQVSGPEVWTGGVFGPEAGLVVLPGLILGAVLVYLYTSKRKPFQKAGE